MSRVKVDIVADKSGFDAAMKGIKSSLTDLKGVIAGALSVEAIEEIIGKTFEYADTIDKASLRMKLTTEQTQGLSIMAREAGTSLGAIEGAFKKIELARVKALGGNAKALASFKLLGIDIAQLQKPNNKIGLAGNLASAARNGSTDNEGVALQGLGLKKTAGDLAALGDSLQDFDRKINELKDAGRIMPDEDIANMVRARDELAAVGDTLMAHIAPAISTVIEGIEKYYVLFKAYWSNIFAAIITMAGDALTYIKSLPKAFLNSVTGGKGQGLGDVMKQFGSNIATDLKETIGNIVSDSSDGLDEYNKSIAAQMAARAKARENKPEAISTVTPVKTKTENGGKIYSDSLTSIGNLLGSSFSNISSVTTQMDAAKSSASSLNKLTDAAKVHTDLLSIIATNTSQSDEGDDDLPSE